MLHKVRSVHVEYKKRIKHSKMRLDDFFEDEEDDIEVPKKEN